jgi:hypothetical protein
MNKSFLWLLSHLPENVRDPEAEIYTCPYCHTKVHSNLSPAFMNVLGICPACGQDVAGFSDVSESLERLEDDFQTADGKLAPQFVTQLIAFFNIALSCDFEKPYIASYRLTSYNGMIVLSWIGEEGPIHMKIFQIKE